MTLIQLAAMSCLALGQVAAPPMQPQQGEAAAQLKAFAQIAVKEVAGFRLRSPDDEGRKFTLREAPVLKYTNPVSGSMNGNVFLWTVGARPEVVAAVFQFPGYPLSVECHSLSEKQLEVVRDDGVTWRPAVAGVELRAVPAARIPAESRGGRLVQMRELARQFTAERTEPDGQHVPLRLLPQPIYRYEEGDDDRDGALFAFVEGTNPDVLLILEAHDTAGAKAWHFAAARLHHRTMQLRLGDQVVWEVKQLTNAEKSMPEQPYFIFRRN